MNNPRGQNHDHGDNKSAVGSPKVHTAPTCTVDRPTQPVALRNEPEEGGAGQNEDIMLWQHMVSGVYYHLMLGSI